MWTAAFWHTLENSRDRKQINLNHYNDSIDGINSGAADYVVTGCGTGEGAMLACNSFPGVICGHVEDALDGAVPPQSPFLTAALELKKTGEAQEFTYGTEA